MARIKIEVESSEAKRQLDAFAKSWDELLRAVKGSSSSFGQAQKDTKKMAGGFNKAEREASGFSRTLADLKNKLLAITAAGGALYTVFNFGRSIIQTTAQFETLSKQLNTTTKSAENARKSLGWIEEFTKNTPFQLQEVASSFSKLSSVGLDATKILPALGDAVAAVGGGSDELNRVVRQMVQVQSKMRVSAEEMIAISETGIPAMKILRDELGLSAKEMSNLSKAVPDVGVAIDALVKGFQKNFGGAMKTQMDSFKGIVSNLRDQWTLFLKDIGEAGMFDKLRDNLKKVLETINEMRESGDLYKWAVRISDGFLLAANSAIHLGKIMIAGGVLYGGLYGLPALYKAAIGMNSKFIMSMYSAEASAYALANGINFLKASINVLFSFIVGWEIGKWFHDNFEAARLIGLGFVDGMIRGWIEMKTTALITWEMIKAPFIAMIGAMKAAYSGFMEFMIGAQSNIARTLGFSDQADELERMAHQYKKVSVDIGDIQRNIDNIVKAREEELKQHERITEEIRVQHMGSVPLLEAQKNKGKGVPMPGQAPTKIAPPTVDEKAIKKLQEEKSKALSEMTKVTESNQEKFKRIAKEIQKEADRYAEITGEIEKARQFAGIKIANLGQEIFGMSPEMQKMAGMDEAAKRSEKIREQLAQEQQAQEDRERIKMEALDRMFITEEERTRQHYENLRNTVLEMVTITEEEKARTLANIQNKEEKEARDMQIKLWDERMSEGQAFFGTMASMTEEFAGKQSGIYKMMFAASKAFAIADATVKIQKAIADAAAAEGPWYMKLTAMATIAAQTASIVSNIKDVSMSLKEHDTGGNISSGEMGIVGEKGPEIVRGPVNVTSRVETGGVLSSLSDSMRRLTKVIDNPVGGDGNGIGQSNVSVNIINQTGATAEVTEKKDGDTKMIEVLISNTKKSLTSDIQKGGTDFSKALEGTYALRRGKQ